MNFAWKSPTSTNIQGSFTCRKSTTWDRRLYFLSEGRHVEDFFALKNPTVSVWFEPANLGTKGQHATSRPPKPPSLHGWYCKQIIGFLCSRNNSIKSPALAAGSLTEPMLTTQIRRLREVVCALNLCVSAIRAVGVMVFVSLRSSCYHVTEVEGP